MKKILIINGSLGGPQGNTSVLITECQKILSHSKAQVKVLHLETNTESLKEILNWADGLIFTSGTYWDSWGSPMQKFLEDCTEFEGTEALFGKPSAVLITMHSVGGKGVLSRLQGVLNTMGILIPPMTGLVYALSTHLAIKIADENISADFWSLEDVEIVVHNLMTALYKKDNFKCWPVDRKDPKRRWLFD